MLPLTCQTTVMALRDTKRDAATRRINWLIHADLSPIIAFTPALIVLVPLLVHLRPPEWPRMNEGVSRISLIELPDSGYHVDYMYRFLQCMPSNSLVSIVRDRQEPSHCMQSHCHLLHLGTHDVLMYTCMYVRTYA